MAGISCQPQFSWMDNSMQQTPCLVAAWLIGICVTPSNPAGLGQLTSTTPNYLPPNASSASTCSCSWAVYNNLMACTICQGFPLINVDAWPTWSSNCGLQGLSSSTSYWPADKSLVGKTSLPQWSIVNASSWDGQLFNVNQAQAIANRSLPDVTDSNATPPSLAQPSTPPSSTPPSKSTPVGAIAGGVAGGVVFLGFVLLLLWYMCYYRKKVHHAHWHRAHVDLNAEDGEKPLESPPVSAAFSNAGNNMGAVNAMPYDPYAQHHQMQMQQGYAQMQAATYPGAPGFAPMTLASMSSTTHSSSPPPQGQGGARPVTIQTYPLSGGGDAHRIPTVAEQLSEKRRIREERTRPSAARPPPSAFQGLHNNSSGTGASVSVDETGVLAYTGHHSRGMSSVSGLSASGNGSTSNFESQTQTMTHSPSNSQSSSTMHLPTAVRKSSLDTDAGGGEQQPQTRKASRRLSLAKAPWNRRRPAVSEPASSVVGDAEDVGDRQHDFSVSADVSAHNQSQDQSQSPTSPTSTQRRAAVEDVLATVPGARMPSARDREQPPPSYVSVPNVTDMALLSLPGARRMTVMNETGDEQ